MNPSYSCPECFMVFHEWAKAQEHKEKTGHECRAEKSE